MSKTREKGKEKICDEQAFNERKYLLEDVHRTPEMTSNVDYFTLFPAEILAHMASFIVDIKDLLCLSSLNRWCRESLLPMETPYNVIINRNDRNNRIIRRGTLAEIIYVLGKEKEMPKTIQLKSDLESDLEKQKTRDDTCITYSFIACLMCACASVWTTVAVSTVLSSLSTASVISMSSAESCALGIGAGTAAFAPAGLGLSANCLFRYLNTKKKQEVIAHLENEINNGMVVERPIKQKPATLTMRK